MNHSIKNVQWNEAETYSTQYCERDSGACHWLLYLFEFSKAFASSTLICNAFWNCVNHHEVSITYLLTEFLFNSGFRRNKRWSQGIVLVGVEVEETSEIFSLSTAVSSKLDESGADASDSLEVSDSHSLDDDVWEAINSLGRLRWEDIKFLWTLTTSFICCGLAYEGILLMLSVNRFNGRFVGNAKVDARYTGL